MQDELQTQLQTQKTQLDSLMLQVQHLLYNMGLDEHEDIQTAFNALACTLDEVLY